MILHPNQKDSFSSCCLFHSTGYCWQHLAQTCLCLYPEMARLLLAMHWFHQKRPESQPLFCHLLAVTSWRSIFDSCSHRGSERFFIKQLQPTRALDFFNMFVLLEPGLSPVAVSHNLRYGFTHINNQMLLHLFTFASQIPYFRFLLVRRGPSAATGRGPI